MYINYALTLLIILPIFLSSNFVLSSGCTSDTDCGTGRLCMSIDTGSPTPFKKCTVNTAANPACGTSGGSNFGHCPPQDDEIGATMCVLIPSTALRGDICCKEPAISGGSEGGAPATSSAGSGSSTTKPVSLPVSSKAGSGVTKPASVTTSLSGTGSGTNSSRSLLVAASTCVQCFTPPSSGSKQARQIKGRYGCVLTSQCKGKSAFPKSCDIGKTCTTGKSDVCSKQGTCSSSDPNDPVGSFKCFCQPGYGGVKCADVISSDCIADCGVKGAGGKCTKGTCVCNKGFAGKQCEGCADDTTCNSANLGGTCNLKTAKCICNPGFAGSAFCAVGSGNSSSASTATCDKVTCGENGNCIAGLCYCTNNCIGDKCTPCDDADCSTCSYATLLRVNAFVFLPLSFIIFLLS